MDVPDDQRLLVVNLENCIPNTAEEQVSKGECVYAVAVASNTCGPQDGTVIQIPVSVHCSERTQQHYAQVPVQQYTQINVGNEVSSLAASSDSENQILNSEQQAPSLSKADEESSCEEVDSYYEEIFNYLVSQTVPEGCTDKYRKLLHKRARFYKIYNGMLYYGHKQSREVIAEKAQQRQILKDVHIDKLTDIHLGLKKMYVAISQSYFWKGLYVDVANFVRQCKLCSESTLQEDNNEEFHDTETPSQSEKVTKEKGDSSESPNKVWQKVELNILGPYPRTANHNEFIVAITDPFSRWIVARPMDSDFLVETLSDFLFTTFCTFGFTKCNFVGMSEETFEAVQTNYRNRISRIQETLRSDSMKNFIPLLATGTNSLSLLPEDLCECIWLRRHWTEFVSHYPQTWDVEMETFLFKYHTSHRKEGSSPFTIMFGRSPNIYVEEDKENCDMVENDTLAEKISKRRRLQSSILQCRHCEEIFTSKISFRIHQRKHTEEAHRQGTLEGQEPIRSTSEREKRLLRRTVLKRKRFLKHGIKKKNLLLQSEGASNENVCADNNVYIYLDDITNSASSVSDNALYSIENDSSSPNSPVQTSNENCQILVSPVSSENHNKEDRQIIRNDQESEQLNDIACTVVSTSNEQQNASKSTNDVVNNDIIELSLEDTNSTLCQKLTSSQIGHEVIKNSESFHCNQCRKQFSSETKLNSHIEQHSNPLLLCKHCSYSTTSTKLLEYHQNIHSQKFKCRTCDKLFTRKIYVKYHVKNVHRKTRRLHNCEECNAKFLSLSGLKMHIQSSHEQDGYPCSICSYIGKNTNALSCHIARSHRKKYKCNSCKYESLTKGGLDRHEKIYHNPNDRQFACKYCSYRGEKQRQLADHEKTVHGHPQNRHMCPICKKLFRTQVMMKHHLPSHSDQPLYSCKGCNYRTRFRQTLYLHIKNSHPGETFKTMGKGPSDADFQEIIDTALQNLEPFLPCEEQNMAADYINQNPEDSSNYLNVPVQASNPFPAVTCTEEASSSQILTLQKYKSSAPVMNNTLVNHKVVDDLNAGIMQSDHAVAVIDSSGEVQTVVNLTGKKKIQSLFPLNSFHFEGSKIQQVVTLVDSLHAVEETNEHAVMLLDNVVEKSTEHRTVTHISLANNQNLGQENLVILPLGDSNVAIIQNENFSTVQGDNPLVLDHQTALLDLIPEQTEIIHNN